MTEAEWLTATDPRPMLEFLRAQASDRKLRLFAVACCRRRWSQMTDDRCRTAVETAEAFADGRASQRRLSRARSAAHAGTEVDSQGYVTTPLLHAASFCANSRLDEQWVFDSLLHSLRVAWPNDVFIDPNIHERSVQTEICRDIFNPFRPGAFDPAWRSETVSALAAGIYADRAFDRLPILADALEEAGCDQPDILNHCRGPGPHVRGCWAVDLVLGKS